MEEYHKRGMGDFRQSKRNFRLAMADSAIFCKATIEICLYATNLFFTCSLSNIKVF